MPSPNIFDATKAHQQALLTPGKSYTVTDAEFALAALRSHQGERPATQQFDDAHYNNIPGLIIPEVVKLQILDAKTPGSWFSEETYPFDQKIQPHLEEWKKKHNGAKPPCMGFLVNDAKNSHAVSVVLRLNQAGNGYDLYYLNSSVVDQGLDNARAARFGEALGRVFRGAFGDGCQVTVAAGQITPPIYNQGEFGDCFSLALANMVQGMTGKANTYLAPLYGRVAILNMADNNADEEEKAEAVNAFSTALRRSQNVLINSHREKLAADYEANPDSKAGKAARKRLEHFAGSEFTAEEPDKGYNWKDLLLGGALGGLLMDRTLMACLGFVGFLIWLFRGILESPSGFNVGFTLSIPKPQQSGPYTNVPEAALQQNGQRSHVNALNREQNQNQERTL